VAATVLVTMAVVWASSAMAAAAPQLYVRGNKIVNGATGKQYMPRGVHWASFEYRCTFGDGYFNEPANTDPDEPAPNAASITALKSWHINTVRIALNQDCWLNVHGFPTPPLTAAGYQQSVKSWVDLLTANGFAVILDLHWTGPGNSKADQQHPMTDPNSLQAWTSVATMFKSYKNVMFELFNEPFSPAYHMAANPLMAPFQLTWACWRDGGCTMPAGNQFELAGGNADFMAWTPADGTYVVEGMQDTANAVRATGAKQPLLVGGLKYSNDLTGWLANRPTDGAAGTADDQLVAVLHTYGGPGASECQTVACWDAQVAPVAQKVPVIATEFGQADCAAASHNAKFMRWADTKGVSYMAFAWWVVGPVCPVVEHHQMLQDSNGTPSAYGLPYKQHLQMLFNEGKIT
jgi:hypothetical protein